MGEPTVPRERVRLIEMDGPAPDARNPDDAEELADECQEWGERGWWLSLTCYRPANHVPPVHWDAHHEIAWYDAEWFGGKKP